MALLGEMRGKEFKRSVEDCKERTRSYLLVPCRIVVSACWFLFGRLFFIIKKRWLSLAQNPNPLIRDIWAEIKQGVEALRRTSSISVVGFRLLLMYHFITIDR